MKRLTLWSICLLPCLAYANPEVTKNTDVNKRKVNKHYQVTECESGKCKVFEVTEFDKEFEGRHEDFYNQCTFVVKGKKRFMACNKDAKPTTKVVEKVVEKIVEKTVEKPVQKYKNRISVMGGVGYDGLSTKSNDDVVSIEQDFGLVFGLTYQRSLSERWNVGGTALTNQTFGLTLGYDF